MRGAGFDPHQSDQAMSPEQKTAAAKLDKDIQWYREEGHGIPPDLLQKRMMIQRQADQQYAASMITQATKAGPEGAGARARLQQLGKDHPDWFPEGVGAGLEQPPTSPADQAALEAQGRQNARKMGRELDADKLAETQQQRMNESQGNRNQRQYAKEQDAEDLRVKQANTAADMKARENAKRAAKELDRTAESEAMGASVSKRDMELDYARRGVAGAAAQRGMQFDPAMLDQMASSALNNYKGGMTEQAAVFSALASKLQQMERMGQQFQQMMARGSQQFGGDNSGQFSQMSPFLP